MSWHFTLMFWAVSTSGSSRRLVREKGHSTCCEFTNRRKLEDSAKRWGFDVLTELSAQVNS